MICFFNTARAWGGGEKWHFDIAVRLHEDGEPVIVVAHTRSELARRLKRQGIEPHTLKISNLSFLNVLKMFRLARFFKQRRVAALVVNLPSDLKTAAVAARFAGVKRIVYRRGSAIPIRDSRLNRLLFGRIITDVLVNSRATKSTILANNPNLFRADRITVIYNGLKLNEFGPSPAPAASKGGQPVVIGNLARLEKQKAQHLLIELGGKLREAGYSFNILIGGDGRLKEELSRQIVEARLQERVRLVGHVDDVAAFMQGIDMFVLTSLWEGFGYVLAEAMACAKPVVAFDHSSNPEVVEHGKTGLLAASGNLEELFQNVVALMSDERLRAAMGKAGREKVRREFDFETTCRQVRDFLLRE